MTERRSAKLVLTPEGGDPATLEPMTTVHATTGTRQRATARRARPHPLPVVLAGPILRRVSSNEALVWIATSAPFEISGRVVDARSPSTVYATGRQATRRFGAHLHIALVRMRTPRAPFLWHRILAYDLELTPAEGWTFVGGDGLIPAEEIVYYPYTLPTFVACMAPRGDCLKVTHASCRKFHGDGPDAMRFLDRRFQREAAAEREIPPERVDQADTTWERPAALLLTGDQIYADDVHPDFVRVMSAWSKHILGFREQVPGFAGESDDLVARHELSEVGHGTRASLVEGFGFTSGEADNHLMGFGEFAVMYLMAWSPALWEHPPIQDLLSSGALVGRFHGLVGARAARRALANVVTYMIQDDHEVTDDWPMSTEQWNRIKHSPGGRWIVGCALAAAWIFQLEGNDPGNPGGRSLERALSTYLAAGARCRLGAPRSGSMSIDTRAWRQSVQADAEDRNAVAQAGSRFGWSVLEMIDVDLGSGSATASRAPLDFGFVTPTTPPILFVDTRLRRSLHAAPTCPGLLHERARAALHRCVQGIVPFLEGYPLVVVSPAPLLGNPAIPAAQSAGSVLHPFDATAAFYEFDTEQWEREREAFFGILAALSSADKIVVLSGDVHHGYVATGTYRQGSTTAATFVQLTSTALRNAPSGTMAAAMRTQLSSGGCSSSWTRGRASFEMALQSLHGGDLVITENHYATVSICRRSSGPRVETEFIYGSGTVSWEDFV